MTTERNFNPANYKSRIISAAIILVVLVASILLRQISESTRYIFDIFIGFLMVMSAFEIEQLLKKSDKPAYIIGMGLFPLLCFISLIVCISYQTSFYIYLATVVGLLVATYLVLFLVMGAFLPEYTAKEMMEDEYKGSKWSYVAKKSANTILGCIYPTVLLCFFFLINHFNDFFTLNVEYDAGFLGIILVLVTTMMADTFAMLIGRLLNTPKINLEKLGPGKTWGGFAGGIVGAILGALLVYVCFNTSPSLSDYFANNGITIWIFLIGGLFCGLFNMCGDITASYLKRRAGIKDFGKMIPGHGGIMDRINGLVFNVIFVFLFLLIIFMV